MFAWACRHVRWTRAMWSRKRFSDESRFNLSTADGRVRVVRRKGEHFAAQNGLLERDRIGDGLGGIIDGSKTDLVIINVILNAQGYVDNLLRPIVPFLEQHPGCLRHDKPIPHTARLKQAFLPDTTLTSCHGMYVLRT